MERQDDTRRKVFSGLFWRFLERGGSQIVTLLVTIILQRLLEPAMYGTVSKVTVITAILLVFVDSGMANALIQKKDPDDLDFSSVFYFNIFFCLLLYLALFLLSPWLSAAFREPGLTPVLRVLGLTLIVAGLKNVQEAYVKKTMQFKRFFFATLGGTLFSGALGIVLALRGFGVWALVAQQLSNAAVNTAILWLTIPWRPKRMFSWRRLQGNAEMAFFEKGQNWPNLLMDSVNTTMDSVLLPALSAEQERKERLRSMTRRAIQIGSFVIMPLLAGFAACATPLVRLLVTEKWLPTVPYLRIFCVIYAFYPMHLANLNAIKALGRSDMFLLLEIVKRGLELVILLCTVRHGAYVMALGLLGSELASQGINAWPNGRLIDYSYWKQLKDIAPILLLSLLMAACVYGLSFLALPDALILLIQIMLGVGIYAGGARLLKLDSFDYLIGTIRNLILK